MKAPMKPVTLPGLATAVAALLLAGCSGGAPTTQNPNLQAAAQVATYTGPAPGSADVQAFESNLWVNISPGNRCGNCHKAGGQTPMFARSDDINLAYSAALTVVNLSQPDTSLMVQKVGGGHNCWLSSPQACADILTTWISNWAGGGSGSTAGTQIKLTAPPSQTVGATKVFPADATLFSTTIYPVVQQWCARCHSDTAATPQSPYFASSSLTEAYLAAQPEIDLNTPTNSVFYLRLAQQSHNCWGNPVNCPASAAVMLAALQAYAGSIPISPVDPTLVVSKALSLTQGTVASGANRYDAHAIAKWEFKEGTGTVAYDTSGVDPGMDLTLSGNTAWVGGWGVSFGGNGRAQASTATSSKLYNKLSASAQYSVELWVNAANVTQTKAYMASYSGGDTLRNFTVAQDAFQYEAFARSSATDQNGAPTLITNANNQLAQAALQHVVMTYDTTRGRRLYVNGVFTGDVDSSTGGAINNWDTSFAFLVGNETSGDHPWTGTLRFAAVHDVALTQQQIQQNYAAGVGATYFLLFDVSSLTNTPQSYIMLTASQYDSYSYLFARPTFISLDPTFKPSSSIPIQGIRIGVNGAEVPLDQAYIPLSVNVNSSDYSPTTGQLLSPIGTVIPVENGPASDQFFLTFAHIGTLTHAYSVPVPIAPTPVDLPPSSDIGMRVFDEVNASMAKLTTVASTTPAVNSTYLTVETGLPTVFDIQSASSGAQIASAQLAMQYCQALVNDPTLAPAFFPGMNFNAAPSSAFATTAGMDQVVQPLINHLIGQNVATQPAAAAVSTELYSLITDLSGCGGGACPAGRTQTITMAACTAILSSATTLIK
ncbi:MAG: LamG domain-containing protein [Steroidobacterales bacterium]